MLDRPPALASGAGTGARAPALKFVLLGGGAVTSEYYLPALYLMGRLGGVTVVDPDAESMRRRHAEFAAASFVEADYQGWIDGLGDDPSAPESIVIALPNHLHVDAARRALGQGRHVLCEKPLALTSGECSELAMLAEQRGRLLKVAMSRRYLASLRLAREMVLGNELGAVRAVEVHDRQPFLWRPRSFTFFAPEAGGVLADMGVHYLDYVETLVGPLTPIDYSDDARGGTESSLCYELAAGEIAVFLKLSRLHRSGGWLRIACERGDIQVEKAAENEVRVMPLGSPARRVVVEHPFNDESWPSGFHGSFAQMLSDFERAVHGEQTALADVRDAERTAGLIEWAYARRGGRPSRRIAASQAARDRILVTGGTGFIGGHLVERLAAEDAVVRVSARSPATCANVARFPVELQPVDLLDRASVQAAVEGSRVVYHLAYGNDGPDQARITIEGTRNVVEAAIAARAECVVVLSTMYVFGFPAGSGPIDETFPYRPFGGDYAESKATMERWCLERARSSGSTRIVVLNPSCVFGPGGGAYTCLPADLAAKGAFCWIDGGRGTANYVFVENLVDAMLAAAEQPAAHGERFIVNDGSVTWRELLSPFVAPLGIVIPDYSSGEFRRLARFGGPFRLRDLVLAATSAPEVRQVMKRSALVRQAFAIAGRMRPRAPMRADLLQSLTKVAAAEPAGDPPEWLAMLYGPSEARFSSSKAAAVLGWRPRVDLETAQNKTVGWLVENGRLPHEQVG